MAISGKVNTMDSQGQVQVKAFGKVLVFGGYAILEEGNIGLVVNVDKGTEVTVRDNPEGRFSAAIPQYDLHTSGSFEEGKLVLDQGDTRLSFLVNAVTYARQYLEAQHVPFRDVGIITRNDAELIGSKGKKTGLGSSASSTVAIVAAILKFHGVDDRDVVYKISCYSHHLTQDRFGSNYDVYAACYGSHFFTGSKMKLDEHFMRCISAGWNISRDSYTWPEELLPVLVFTGHVASTRHLVEKVLQYRKKHRKDYEALMSEYNGIDIKLREAFIGHDLDLIPGLLERSWEKRRELGERSGANIEPQSFTELMQEMKAHGALAAGLVGAGGGDSILALCRDKQEQDKLIAFAKRKRYLVLENLNVIDSGYVFLE
ncbi:MAG: hypothetical protein GXP63_00670 [DPANN group archaeon]|nr:hypothetical protein [DPANN group archaeon]